jgi:hypothetical protein
VKRDELESSELQELPWPQVQEMMFGSRAEDEDVDEDAGTGNEDGEDLEGDDLEFDDDFEDDDFDDDDDEGDDEDEDLDEEDDEFDSELDDSLIDLDDEYDEFNEEDRHKPGHTPYEE